MDKILNPETAIQRLSNALAILNTENYDKEIIKALTNDLLDEKHKTYLDIGLQTNDKSMIMHAIIGALSHYESQQDNLQKKFANAIA